MGDAGRHRLRTILRDLVLRLHRGIRALLSPRNAVFDSLARNAYGMYLVHYAFASWTQFALLPARLGGLQKGLIVFGTVVIMSWMTSAILRRVPVVARVI